MNNWQGENPFAPEPCEWRDSAGDKMLCLVHDGELIMTDDDWQDDDIDMICKNILEFNSVMFHPLCLCYLHF